MRFSIFQTMRSITIFVLLFLLKSVYGTHGVAFNAKNDPIRIALAVDMRSFKDFLVLAHSIVLTAMHPESLYLHVVACGKNTEDARRMRDVVLDLTSKCIPLLTTSHLEVVAFTLPAKSGFAKQLVTVIQKSHWYSPTGADMARFYLADLFPKTRRLLYLDNDIVVTCCLEEIFYTELASNMVAGIVLDDLKWATSTQFHRHYNHSHPLVIKNVRRGYSGKGEISGISEDEFMKRLPKYPNDGVLLIDTERWRKEGILPLMNEIAEANGRGEYVVSLGTQQFTVLALWDRWKELTPRANLRHFPDMARGFLMWYLYNGFVHFAGQSKPQHVCDANSALDHRVHTYHSWAFNVDRLSRNCPRVIPNATQKCGEMHVPRPSKFSDFLSLVRVIAGKSRDENLLYVRFGGLLNWKDVDGKVSRTVYRESDLITQFDKEILFNSSWSWRIFDSNSNRSKSSEVLLHQSWPESSNKKGKQTKRSLIVINSLVCDGSDALGTDGHIPVIERTANSIMFQHVDKGGNIDPSTSLASPCFSALTSIKLEKTKPRKAHWDVMAVGIDVLPSFGRERASSLGALKSLELEFLRPKFIIVRLGRIREVIEATRFLDRHGYNSHAKGNVIFALRLNKLELL